MNKRIAKKLYISSTYLTSTAPSFLVTLSGSRGISSHIELVSSARCLEIVLLGSATSPKASADNEDFLVDLGDLGLSGDEVRPDLPAG